MNKIDSEINSILHEGTQDSVQVLIICKSDCDVLEKYLENRGINVLSQIPELNILQAMINNTDIVTLSESDDVEYVELDKKNYITIS
jgi:hypothetical protein